MIVDYKKSCKEIYLPKTEPSLITLPPIAYAAVKGSGDPNTSKAYKDALELLYGLLYTIKMSKRSDHPFAGYFDYVVPPLEGLWENGGELKDAIDKHQFVWISMIRLPEFIDAQAFDQAVKMLHAKKPKLDVSKLFYKVYEEGLCVQCMHLGSYDDEPATLAKMNAYLEANGYCTDINETRWHHEIYLSDPRKCASDKLKTVIRHPIRSMKAEQALKKQQCFFFFTVKIMLGKTAPKICGLWYAYAKEGSYEKVMSWFVMYIMRLREY